MTLTKGFIFLIFSFFLNSYTNDSSKKEQSNAAQEIWWKEAVVYQLYPRSFQDTDGDGVGDLKGITKRLDYLQSLGIVAIWLNPICVSPNDDNGYDISDYKAIMREMGTIADFDVGDYIVGKNNVIGIKKIVSKWDEKFLNNGWNTIFWGNHDHSRAVSKYGNDAPEFRNASATMLHTFLLSQRALPYLYNDDEIGMTNIRFKSNEQYNDLQTRNRYYLALKESPEKAAAYLHNQAELSRDNGPTPMQWDGTPKAGFTSGNPWLPINENTKELNVQAQESHPNSVLNYVRKMIQLRKKEKEVLVYGKYTLVDPDNKHVFAYTRSSNHKTFLVLLNFTKEISKTALPKGKKLYTLLLNNLQTIQQDEVSVQLQPYQACIFVLK